MSNKTKVYLADYAGACDDVEELSNAIIALTDKPTVAFALVDLLIRRAKFAGECWANLQRLNFNGSSQDALLADHNAE